MFLLVYVRHVGAHPDELHHGVSIQSSINLGKTFPPMSRIRVNPSTQILARVFVYLPPFIFQIRDFYLFWMAWQWKPVIAAQKRCEFWFFLEGPSCNYQWRHHTSGNGYLPDWRSSPTKMTHYNFYDFHYNQ